VKEERKEARGGRDAGRNLGKSKGIEQARTLLLRSGRQDYRDVRRADIYSLHSARSSHV
jgi:hypothetical protein